MNESQIQEQFTTLPEGCIEPLACYTTRAHGFADIFLTGRVLSSEQIFRLLGEVHTHRDDGASGGRNFGARNDTISFSAGMVSFKYSDRDIRSRKDFSGGYGIIAPVTFLLERTPRSFSHASQAGGIIKYDLNEGNFLSAWHIARTKKELFDDGFGNVFEILLDATKEASASASFPKITQYPEVKLEGPAIVAIPEAERGTIEALVNQRRSEYEEIVAELSPYRGESRSIEIRGRRFLSPRQTLEFLEPALQRTWTDNRFIEWYTDRNLEIALRRLSIIQARHN